MHPPPELKCLSNKMNHGRDQKNCRDEAIPDVNPDAAAAAVEEETEQLYKAYYFARKNLEWRLTHGRTEKKNDATKHSKKRRAVKETYEMAEEKQSATSFPLELQRKFAKVRKKCILQSKKDCCGHVMKKRLGREREKLAVSHEKSAPCNSSLLNGGRLIPATLARQIIQNIKLHDLSAIENIRDTVVLETRRVLGLLHEADGTSSNHVQQGCNIVVMKLWTGIGADKAVTEKGTFISTCQ
jgi:hypothetical protein